jgi:hypothetical protein
MIYRRAVSKPLFFLFSATMIPTQKRGPDYDLLSQQWHGPELQHCSIIKTDWPSATPLTNPNFGVRLYEVDAGNFDIYEE